jgi:putative ABC transport system substrate-binding protein
VRSARRGLASIGLVATALLVSLGGLGGTRGRADASGTAPVLLLRSGNLDPYREAERGFRLAFKDSVVVLDASSGSEEAIAGAIRGLHPQVVVAIGLRAAILARDHLAHLPVVYCAIPHPQRFDLDAEWMAGVRTDVDPALEVRALCQVAPGAKSIGYLCSADANPDDRRRARDAARAAGLEFVEAPIANASELPQVARRLAARVQALWIPADPLVATPQGFQFLLALSLESRLPILAFTDALVKKGALVAVTPDYVEAGGLAAQQVHRIRVGERPTDLPALAVTRMHTVVNLATARSLGTAGNVSALRGLEFVP